MAGKSDVGLSPSALSTEMANQSLPLEVDVFWKEEEVSRHFNDSIHGHIEISAGLMRIVDMPCFQRLRQLAHLGVTSRVYPMAENSRFPHSLGVCHLANVHLNQLVEHWKGDGRAVEDFPGTNEEMLCVEIDVTLCIKRQGKRPSSNIASMPKGHGPYSHSWDNVIAPSILEPTGITAPKHEHISIFIFHDIIWPRIKGRISAKKRLPCEGDCVLDDDRYRDLVCRIIAGGEDDYPVGLPSSWQDPGKERLWLYQIVANKRFEVDVDKFDYIKRDSQSLGMGCTVNFQRLILKARIRCVGGTPHNGDGNDVEVLPGSYVIAYKDEEDVELYELFHMRSLLHRRVYQHKTCQACDLVLEDILVKTADMIVVDGMCLTEVIKDVRKNLERFLLLTDAILQQVTLLDPKSEAFSEEQKQRIKEAHFLLQRYNYRRLYRYVGCCYLRGQMAKQKERDLLQDFCERANVDRKEVVLKKTSINYCCGDKNPLSYAFFFDSAGDGECFSKPGSQISGLQIPKQFNEVFVRLFYKGSSGEVVEGGVDIIENLASQFEAWTRDKGSTKLTPKKRMRFSFDSQDSC